MDNLEFCQWLKKYFELNFSGTPYDAVGKRKGAQLYYIAGGNKVNKLAGGGKEQGKLAGIKPRAPATSSGPAPGAKPASVVKSNGAAMGGPGAAGGEAAKLKNQIQELKLNMDTYEKERDFYFGKLRDIEMMLQL